MSKTVEIQIEKSRSLVEGLRRHVKEMFGLMCIVGTIVLLLMLLYDVQPVRSTMRKMPKLKNLGLIVVRQLRG